MPTNFLSLEGSNMVQRKLGTVYCYAPGGCINVCYSEVTESEMVNQFAIVKSVELLGVWFIISALARPNL
jgi:hypothetical protein